MTLQTVELPFDSLLPIQAAGVGAPQLLLLSSGIYPSQIEVVPYDDGMNLLIDGHHTAYLAHQRGEKRVLATRAIDDEGILSLKSEAVFGFHSIGQIHKAYREVWLPLVQEAGITSIATLPIHNRPRYY